MPKAQLFEIDPHPAIPPAGLLKEWEDLWHDGLEHGDVLLIRAFQAGADQELEACVEWMCGQGWKVPAAELRTARRPKSPSLKEQALALIDECTDPESDYLDDNALATIRRALEQLDD